MMQNTDERKNGKVLMTRTCWRCNETTTIEVDESDYLEWKRGKMIQHALNELTDDERELLISSTCGSCFDELYPEE